MTFVAGRSLPYTTQPPAAMTPTVTAKAAPPARSGSIPASAPASASASASSSTTPARPKYSVILPTYNERQNLPLITALLTDTFATHGLQYEIVIVDDNSPDGTAAVAEQLRAVYGEQHVKLLKRAGKLGLGSAYRDGLGHVTGEWVLLMDADFSHHPKFIPAFIEQQRRTGADIVTGSRYIDGGGVHGWDLRRKLTSRGANYIANALLAPACSDLTGSFRLYRREAIQTVIGRVKSSGYVFQMEMMVRAKQCGYSVAEVPITFVDRVYGESKLGGMEIVHYLNGLYQLFWDV